MAKRTTAFDLAALTLNPQADQLLYQQLYANLRQAVLTRRLAPGIRLPSTRYLAQALAVSRNTVVTAFEQLIAEGYLESRTGDGTYVSRALPDEMLLVRQATPPSVAIRTSVLGGLSARSQALASAPLGVWSPDSPPWPFRPDLMALDHFPVALWTRLVTRRWHTLSAQLLGYGEPAGYRPLREAIAAYLGAARGVRCTADQVIVTTGAQQGIDLAVRTLLNPGDQVWLENPGYRGILGALVGVGAQIVPVPVDREGLCVKKGVALAPQARAVYVTPSHQYPLGVTMSLARRLGLLEWARRANGWIVEDDYDSEFRYVGRPLSSLQGLDPAERVIYIGTFSKVLFPSLRLAYLVVPLSLVEIFSRARALVDRQSPTVEQAVLADFIVEGHFARHIRRMRMLYAERQANLVTTLGKELGDRLEIVSAEAGLHVVGWLPPGVDDRQASQAAQAQGIETPPLSTYALAPLARGGLVMGYAALNESQIRTGVEKLRAALTTK
jgi:GntR family transcriptional regulator/MocR family aminotransferase